MKSTHYNENPINYYDIIIDINSFRHLNKDENNNDWGWNVEINKNFNYIIMNYQMDLVLAQKVLVLNILIELTVIPVLLLYLTLLDLKYL